MRDATDEELEQIATEVSHAVVTDEHLREFLKSNLPEIAHLTNSTYIGGEHVSLSEEQQEELVDAAISGMYSGLQNLSETDS